MVPRPLVPCTKKNHYKSKIYGYLPLTFGSSLCPFLFLQKDYELLVDEDDDYEEMEFDEDLDAEPLSKDEVIDVYCHLLWVELIMAVNFLLYFCYMLIFHPLCLRVCKSMVTMYLCTHNQVPPLFRFESIWKVLTLTSLRNLERRSKYLHMNSTTSLSIGVSLYLSPAYLWVYILPQ